VLAQLGHLGKLLALEIDRQRAGREHARAAQVLGAKRSISTRPGSSSTGSVSGEHTSAVMPPATAACISEASRVLEFLAGLAQAVRTVDHTGRDDQALGVDGGVRAEIAGFDAQYR